VRVKSQRVETKMSFLCNLVASMYERSEVSLGRHSICVQTGGGRI
jgi:hypothetical protein